MTRLLRSRFPVAALRSTALQLEMFGGEGRTDTDAGTGTVRTPAMRRWSEVETWSAVSDDGAHRSRESQLARPQHGTPKPRASVRYGADGQGVQGLPVNEIIGSEGASCGRSAVTDEAGAAAGIVAHRAANPGVGFDASVAPRNDRVAQQPAAFAPVDVRTTGIRVATMASGAVQAPRAITLAPAQPAWSCATTWLRSVKAKGEGSTQSVTAVTAVASYVFVAVMIACTFLV